jgi:hypothetical protein
MNQTRFKAHGIGQFSTLCVKLGVLDPDGHMPDNLKLKGSQLPLRSIL